MKIYIFDRDYQTLKAFDTYLHHLVPKAEISIFTSVTVLYRAVVTNAPDIIFAQTDETPPETLTKELQGFAPVVKLVLTANGEGLCVDSLNAGAAGFLAKPFTEQQLQQLLCRLRHPLLSRVKRLIG